MFNGTCRSELLPDCLGDMKEIINGVIEQLAIYIFPACKALTYIVVAAVVADGEFSAGCNPL